ncbi:hypothetical protein F4825DRAFT_78760 [Nemania diffusa]|nr:hypothetical protein F4825DRAFT_78760 [Nemania diffusa]
MLRNFRCGELGLGIREGITNLLDVVVGKGSAILELLSGEDETLLIRGDSLLILNLALHVVDGIGGLDLEGDGLAREGLDEDLHCRLREAMVSSRLEKCIFCFRRCDPSVR